MFEKAKNLLTRCAKKGAFLARTSAIIGKTGHRINNFVQFHRQKRSKLVKKLKVEDPIPNKYEFGLLDSWVWEIANVWSPERSAAQTIRG